MPCNLYGPNDNYDLNNSHVIAAILEKLRQQNTNKQQIYLWEWLSKEDYACR